MLLKLGNLFAKYSEWWVTVFLVNLKGEGLRLYKNDIFYRYFTRILPRFKAKLHSFMNLLEHLFYRKPFSMAAYYSCARVLCDGLCNLILHVCENCWKNFELAHLMHLQKIFHRKELNATKDDWFLMHSISILPKS